MDEKVAKTPRPHMLDADEVAELLRIKKGSAYEVIRKINAEQGGARARGHPRARSKATSSTPCTSRRWTDMPVYKDDGNGTFYVQCYYRAPAARSATRRSAASPPRWRPQCGRASSRALTAGPWT